MIPSSVHRSPPTAARCDQVPPLQKMVTAATGVSGSFVRTLCERIDFTPRTTSAGRVTRKERKQECRETSAPTRHGAGPSRRPCRCVGETQMCGEIVLTRGAPDAHRETGCGARPTRPLTAGGGSGERRATPGFGVARPGARRALAGPSLVPRGDCHVSSVAEPSLTVRGTKAPRPTSGDQ